MPHFVIESTHTAEECLEAHDQVAALGQELFSQYYWSCPCPHAGWVMLEAEDARAAQAAIPNAFRRAARLIRAEKLTLEQLRAAHSNL
ncbi:MAG TPA: hypothetical protein VFD70_24035 [Anaerolineae bacterium]|nr:hypothetical protein [Anaerolineae bacterium]